MIDTNTQWAIREINMSVNAHRLLFRLSLLYILIGTRASHSTSVDTEGWLDKTFAVGIYNKHKLMALLRTFLRLLMSLVLVLKKPGSLFGSGRVGSIWWSRSRGATVHCGFIWAKLAHNWTGFQSTRLGFSRRLVWLSSIFYVCDWDHSLRESPIGKNGKTPAMSFVR